ncbi:MAG TPA: hypothetical protein VFU21_05830 [Kofleriaceae bacterium]|nr:hypothetical protein [Kofleriaceae bacterium]
MKQTYWIKWLSLAPLFIAAACSTEIDGDDQPRLDEIQVNGPVCEISPPDGNGGVWLNFDAGAIGCGCCAEYGTIWIDGFSIPGREKCFYQWLQYNNPDIVEKLGSPTASEFRYDPPGTIPWVSPEWWPDVAWGVPFSQGEETGFSARIQFMYNGSAQCGGLDTHDGYLKVYYYPERAAGKKKGKTEEVECEDDEDCQYSDPDNPYCDWDSDKNKKLCKKKRCQQYDCSKTEVRPPDLVSYCRNQGSTNLYCGPSNSHMPCQGDHLQYYQPYEFWVRDNNRCEKRNVKIIECIGAAEETTAVPPQTCSSLGYINGGTNCVIGPQAFGKYFNGFNVPYTACP